MLLELHIVRKNLKRTFFQGLYRKCRHNGTLARIAMNRDSLLIIAI